MNKFLLSFILLTYSCSTGNLKVIADINSDLEEASALEIVKRSNLLWTIEDAGNKNNLYGLDLNGKIVKDIDISNVKNEDWEDLTSDALGNIYIGDFGNNNKKRENFSIYKVSNLTQVKDDTTAEIINFKLPKDVKSEDFEAFFLLDNAFYIFSKENKTSLLLKVPNTIGNHVAELVTDFNLDGKHNKITSAAVSANGEIVVLLNHDKLWKLTNFKPDAFFKGKVEELKFNHSSQKEGICFKNDSVVYISDERHKTEGGNIYEFKLN
ncbi:hypothetical protein L3X39_11415 [Sabulilitoribacter multivorans]|uniref:SdiA-regulated n=1 Tax=Flaviramulus multivorans TaxID=1304750 RepID=A0ABS9IKV8_9FLAO|nr:hypothetical protein [Flaviramulus multivorans]MCF7561246.1 hypothetical protein [Flaviramulus multivorans]